MRGIAGLVFVFLTGLVCGELCQAQHLLYELQSDDSDYGAGIAIGAERLAIGSPTKGAKKKGAVYIYDILTGEELLVVEDPSLPKNARLGWRVAATGSIGFATVGNGATERIRAFDLNSGATLYEIPSPTWADSELGATLVADADRLYAAVTRDPVGGTTNTGSVYVFDTADGELLLQLVPEDPQVYLSFGTSVAISGDAILVGAPGDDRPAFGAGSAYLFDRSTGRQIFKLTAPDAERFAMFGFSVAITDKYLAVGAPDWDGKGQTYRRGAVYIYDRATGAPVRQIPAPLVMGGNARFGHSLAASGETLFVGEPFRDSGYVYAYSLERATMLFTVSPATSWKSFNYDGSAFFSYNLAVCGDRAVVGRLYRHAAYVYAVPSPAIGDTYCSPSVPNSTDASAEVRAYGSRLATCWTVKLEAVGMPPNQLGVFLASTDRDFVPHPPGSQGNLCLRSPLHRIDKEVLHTGAEGAFSLRANLSGALPILPGDKLYFQAWFRDANPGPTSNFTDGVAVEFL